MLLFIKILYKLMVKYKYVEGQYNLQAGEYASRNVGWIQKVL